MSDHETYNQTSLPHNEESEDGFVDVPFRHSSLKDPVMIGCKAIQSELELPYGSPRLFILYEGHWGPLIAHDPEIVQVMDFYLLNGQTYAALNGRKLHDYDEFKNDESLRRLVFTLVQYQIRTDNTKLDLQYNDVLRCLGSIQLSVSGEFLTGLFASLQQAVTRHDQFSFQQATAQAFLGKTNRLLPFSPDFNSDLAFRFIYELSADPNENQKSAYWQFRREKSQAVIDSLNDDEKQALQLFLDQTDVLFGYQDATGDR